MNPAHLALAAVAGLALAGRSRRGGRNDGADEEKWRTVEKLLEEPVLELTPMQLRVLKNEGRLVDTAGNAVKPKDIYLYEFELHVWRANAVEGTTPRITGHMGYPVRFEFQSGGERTDYNVPLPLWIGFPDKNLGWVHRRLPEDIIMDWS